MSDQAYGSVAGVLQIRKARLAAVPVNEGYLRGQAAECPLSWSAVTVGGATGRTRKSPYVRCVSTVSTGRRGENGNSGP